MQYLLCLLKEVNIMVEFSWDSSEKKFPNFVMADFGVGMVVTPGG